MRKALRFIKNGIVALVFFAARLVRIILVALLMRYLLRYAQQAAVIATIYGLAWLIHG